MDITIKDPGCSASIEENAHCTRCGWPVIFACVNDEFSNYAEEQDPDENWDWWMYCSNKGCIKHVGEGKFQSTLEWVKYERKTEKKD